MNKLKRISQIKYKKAIQSKIQLLSRTFRFRSCKNRATQVWKRNLLKGIEIRYENVTSKFHEPLYLFSFHILFIFAM